MNVRAYPSCDDQIRLPLIKTCWLVSKYMAVPIIRSHIFHAGSYFSSIAGALAGYLVVSIHVWYVRGRSVGPKGKERERKMKGG